MGELDRDRIATAALEVVDRHGASGLTMRRVAELLDVTPMALYHHVENKAGLVALMIDTTIQQTPLPPICGDWREDLWALARWMREVTRAHPAVGKLRDTYAVWTPSAVPMAERWVSTWSQSGLDKAASLRAASISSIGIIGVVQQEYAIRSITVPEDALLEELPNAKALFMRRSADDDFELIVRGMIDGIHARLTRPAKRPTKR